MASIRTFSSTVSRIGALNISLKEALRNLGWSDAQIKSFVGVGCTKENKWISEFWTHGVKDGKWRIRVVISVDWDEHDRLNANSNLITIDNRFDKSGKSIGLTEMCADIRTIMVEESLSIHTSVVYTDAVLGDQRTLLRVRRALGTSPSETIQPAGQIHLQDSSQIAGLSELGIRLESSE